MILLFRPEGSSIKVRCFFIPVFNQDKAKKHATQMGKMGNVVTCGLQFR